MNPETKTCQNCKGQFTIEPEDFGFYEKIKVPPPTWCPECRLQRRLSWRNEKSFYRRNCDKCNRSIISVFPKSSGLTVYCNPCWWSDKWDGLEYGMDFDPSRPFLKQVRELLQKTPLPALFGLYTTLENSEYTNMVGNLKNCYLITHSDKDENCNYGSCVDMSKDSVDNLLLMEGELCYETVNCRKCFKTFFSKDCENCNDVSFSFNCMGCSNCIGCANLKNKKYYIFNEPYSQEEYEKISKNYSVNSFLKNESLKKKAGDFWKKFPHKYVHERHNTNSSGDYIYNSKNTKDSFIVADMEDSKFCSLITPGGCDNCYDFTHYGTHSTLTYESLQVGDQTSNVLFGWFNVTSIQNTEYSSFIVNSRNLFGCVSLKKEKYCILNRQYSEEDYFLLRARIIDQMNKVPYEDKRGLIYKYGEFFPQELSPFCYNATSAQESFPLEEKTAKELGYSWETLEKNIYSATLLAEAIPDLSSDIPGSITEEVIQCEHKGQCNEQCSTAFKVISSEIAFYRQLDLPLPHLCPNCRHYQRLKQRNPLKLWHRQCMCTEGGHDHNGRCRNEFETSYTSERPEIVYCEECYQKEVA